MFLRRVLMFSRPAIGLAQLNCRLWLWLKRKPSLISLNLSPVALCKGSPCLPHAPPAQVSAKDSSGVRIQTLGSPPAAPSVSGTPPLPRFLFPSLRAVQALSPWVSGSFLAPPRGEHWGVASSKTTLNLTQCVSFIAMLYLLHFLSS